MSQVRTLAAGGITGALLVGLIKVGYQPTLPTPTPVSADTQVQIRQEVGTFARLAKELKPSVVNIAVEKVVERPAGFEMFPFDFRRAPRGAQPFQPRERGQGSGVIISSDGYIATNNHVVEGVSQARVTLSDGSELAAKVVGTDPKTDLALLKVDSKKALPAARLGNSDQLEVGDWVMAIGNPFGLEATVTVGVLSGKGRVIGAGPYDNFLQTDASINPGNSGGPLFNTQGQVVGINTAIIAHGQGIGFSIPINMARDVVEQLKSQGKVVRGFIGVGIQPLNPRLKSALKVPDSVQGALVSSLVETGPAGKAGVKVQDIITSVNGKAVRSDRELLAEVARIPVGQQATLQVWRKGSTVNLKVPVVARPDEQQVSVRPNADPSEEKALGMVIQPLTPEIAQELSSSNAEGVVVVEVAPNSPAARAGVRRGDIIRQVNDAPVKTPDQLVSALKSGDPEAVAFLVEREGTTVFLTVEG